ncbi:hypothetical protein A2768_00930 [Candidatus Roizmanbacteria bacterium RIFCSPHIGHO2_01_FULL_37_16]|nr:MAG: hypothetical protein A2768_00930 [Candidatus Roizmanbacteria bacterium RIFCSPHIGHO2_01_FULL_37_16]
MKITSVILTKNEEKNIIRSIKSIQFSDEIIIIDDFSTDRTVEMAEKFGAKIYKRKSAGDFAGQRNFAMEKAKNEWVLFIDADETISEQLKSEIELKIKNEKLKNKIEGFYLRRRDFFWNKEMKYGETAKIRNQGLIRLVRKGSGKWIGKVHEEFKLKKSVLYTERLKNFIDHYPHPTVKEFLQTVNYYSTLRAEELQAKGKKAGILAIIFYPFGKFFLTYVLKLGFLDGAAGFAYAFFMSFHSFLVRAKLYQFTKIDKQSS